MKIAGMIIMVLGLGMTVFTTISYFTREKVLQIGTVELTANQQHNMSWSPFIGLAIMVVGGFLILQARKKN
jgi:LPXTG-motif cell wall-anchored protein